MDRTAHRSHFDQALAAAEPEFGSFFLARFLDLDITYDEAHQGCTVALPYSPLLLNPQGSVHGGVLTTVMDISMGHLCHYFLSTAVTLEMHVRFLRAVRGDCRAEAHAVKAGRSIVHLESRLYGADERLAALATGSWHRLSAAGPT